MDETKNERETTQRAIAEKLGKRICLNCGDSVPADEPYRRGLCAPDYQAAHRAIQLGFISWDLLEQRGVAAAPEKGGRPRTRHRDTPLDALIAAGRSRRVGVDNRKSPNDSPGLTPEAAYDKHAPKRKAKK